LRDLRLIVHFLSFNCDGCMLSFLTGYKYALFPSIAVNIPAQSHTWVNKIQLTK
jgi:hypothetical protein